MQNNAALKTVLFKFQWKASQSDNLPYSNVVFESDLVMNSAMIKPKLYIQLQVETWIGRVKIQPRLEWTHLNDNTDPKNVTTWPTIRIIIHVLSLIAHEYSLNKVWNEEFKCFVSTTLVFSRLQQAWSWCYWCTVEYCHYLTVDAAYICGSWDISVSLSLQCVLVLLLSRFSDCRGPKCDWCVEEPFTAVLKLLLERPVTHRDRHS